MEDNQNNIGVVNEGIQKSADTSEQNNSLLQIITNVQEEVKELLNSIKIKNLLMKM